MEYFNLILGLLGGIGIFLYGMHLTSRGMQKLAVSKMKEYISKYTDNRIKGLFAGIIATFFMQSSTATSIILVGLVGGSVLTLWQALGVMLGSSIGTTLTVQVLAFDITKYASLFVFLGVLFTIFVKTNRLKLIGQALLGVGFLFFGIGFISQTLEPLGHDPSFITFMVQYEKIPIVLLLISVLFTVLMHSSAATIVLCMTLISTNVLSLEAAVPIVLGANLGATIPALISSLASSREGKKVALSYFFFKLIGVSIALLLYGFIVHSISFLPGDVERQIANMHTLFNVLTAALFLPLLTFVALLMNRLLPSHEDKFAIQLENQLLELPDEALYNAKKEINQLGIRVENKMIAPLTNLFHLKDYQKSINLIEDSEKDLDRDYHIIFQFLLKLGQQDLTQKQSDLEVKCLYVLNDLEHIGDTVHQIARIFTKMEEEGLQLHDADKEELVEVANRVIETYKQSLEAFASNDMDMAKVVINEQGTFTTIKNDLIFSHFNHVIEEKMYNSKMSANQLELINHLFSIQQQSVHISQTVLGVV